MSPTILFTTFIAFSLLAGTSACRQAADPALAMIVDSMHTVNNGALLTKNSLVGIDQGVFHFFMFSDNKESEDAEKTKRLTLRYVKIAELSLHFDEIILFFQKGALFSLIKY